MTRLVPVQGYDHVAKNDLRKNFAKDAKTFPTVVKVFQNKFGQVVEKSFDLVLCLFGFLEGTVFRDSSKYSDYVQNVRTKSCLPCQCYCKPKTKNVQCAKRPRYELSTTVLRKTSR